jgi:quinolinate synthase
MAKKKDSLIDEAEKIKAELDYCCTSSNAVNIVKSIPEDKDILFLPDMFLGSYVAKMTGRKNMHIWAGECHVHAGITPEDITKKLESMKDTEFIIHPECSCTTPMLYDVANGSFDNQKVSILSTEGMLNHVHKSNAKNFVVATETGILYRMRKDNPGKTFIPASEKAECQYMKMITLEKVYDTLVNEKNVVTVPKEIADKARLAIDRMLAIS